MRPAGSVLGHGGPPVTQPFALFLLRGEHWASTLLPLVGIDHEAHASLFESSLKENSGGWGAESPWEILHKDPCLVGW